MHPPAPPRGLRDQLTIETRNWLQNTWTGNRGPASTFTVIAWAFSSGSTRRTQGGDFYLATRGDLELATSGYFFMAIHRRYTPPPHPHNEALDMLSQSVNTLARESDNDFLAIADEIDRSDTLRSSYWDLQRVDTLSRYGGKLDRAVDALHFAPSSHSRLLQATDLISFLHFRVRRTASTADPRSVRASAELWAIVSDKVYIEMIRP